MKIRNSSLLSTLAAVSAAFLAFGCTTPKPAEPKYPDGPKVEAQAYYGASCVAGINPGSTDLPKPKMAFCFATPIEHANIWLNNVTESRDLVLSSWFILLWPNNVRASDVDIFQQYAHTNITVKDYTDEMERTLRKEDPKAEVTREDKPDGEYFLFYDSPADNSYRVMKIVQGPDGIYTLAVQIDRNKKTPDFRDKWVLYLSTTMLVINPHQLEKK
jgi:hypothetical protein